MPTTRMRKDARVLAVELGGTSVRAGVFDVARRELVDRAATATPDLRGAGADAWSRLVDVVVALTADMAAAIRVGAVGVAFPGPLSPDGVALAAPTVLGGVIALPVAALFAALWPGVPVSVINDLTAAGYRYVGAGWRDFCVLTVGSGIGHKVFLAGRPLAGPGGRGGEIGHLRLDFSPGAAPCACGDRGHLGGLASGRGTIALVHRRAERHPEEFRRSALARLAPDLARLDAVAVAAAYRAGDPFTTAAVGAAVRYLGQGLAAIHLDTGVERIVLIGGFARALGEPYRAQVVAAAREAGWRVGQDWDAIVRLGEPDDDSALIGLGLFAGGVLP